MTVKKYYDQHLDELSPEKRFHYITRMKNFLKTHDYDDYLSKNMPDTNLVAILTNNNYSKVYNKELRRPFFEKYPDLFGVEAALFRVHHLLHEYDLDLRDNFVKLYPINKLYSLVDSLMGDPDAIKALSSWAVNTVCLTEELFPREKDVVKELSKKALEIDPEKEEPTLFVYLCTHIVICESGFYTKELRNSRNLEILNELLNKCAEIILKHLGEISLDALVEYLVCCKMAGVEQNDLRDRIAQICKNNRAGTPYLINRKRGKKYLCSLDGAEHINALYIMSGLDPE